MSSTSNDLKQIIDASVSAGKPDYRKVDATRISRLIEAQSGQSVSIVAESIRGGGEKAGASSGIVIFDAVIGGETTGLVLRYAPMDNPLRLFSEYCIAEQFHLQKRLHDGGLPVPNARYADPAGEILGLPCFIMDRVEGSVADGSPFTGGFIAETEGRRRETLFDEIFSALGRVHAFDWEASEIEPFVRSGGGETHIARYLNWFWKTGVWVRPSQLGRLESAKTWLLRNQPDYAPSELRLIHGDPGLGNYMFRDDRVAAIIDWELCGITHPTYDIVMQVGLNEFFRSSAPPEVARTIPNAEDWMARYCKVTGERLRDVVYYQKLAAFVQLVVSLSMNRSVPAEMRDAHAMMFEPVWGVLEAG